MSEEYRLYMLEINTLESSGSCPTCEKPVSIYKRQYWESSTGRKVQSHCITPCDCRQETFDQYEQGAGIVTSPAAPWDEVKKQAPQEEQLILW